jgi:hypothetical protein
VDVKVTTVGGESPISSADQFTYVAAPTVTSIGPASGPKAGATLVTIAGTNLLGATAVKFGTKAGTIVSTSALQIVAISPAGTAGTAVDVTVATAGGTSPASPADQFSYVAAPTVAKVSPNTGLPAGGTQVTIAGTNLLGAEVNFGTEVATDIVSDTATQIVVNSPAGAAGMVDATVVTAGGTSPTSSADQFIYVAASMVGSAIADTGPLAGTMVTIGGTDLLDAMVVDFGTMSSAIVGDPAKAAQNG